MCPALWLYLVVLHASVLLVGAGGGHNGCISKAENTFCKCSSRGGLLIPRSVCLQQYTKKRHWTKVCCSRPPPGNTKYLNPKAERLARLPCGKRGGPMVQMSSRIHGAKPAIQGEFPWMAILMKQPVGHELLCAGTLIHPQYVLTVRHCTKNYRTLKVLLGVQEWYPSVYRRNRKIQVIPVANVILHPDVQETDAALLRLLHPATLEPGQVEPICLPLTTSQMWRLPNELTIVGWGATETLFNNDGKSRHLMKADVTVLRNVSDHCLQDWDFCAGKPGEGGSCVGDSGGPYQTEEEIFYSDQYDYDSQSDDLSRVVLYGIIRSGTFNCRNQDKSSKAVLVAYLMSWLLNEMIIEDPWLEYNESGVEQSYSNEKQPSSYASDEQTNEEY